MGSALGNMEREVTALRGLPVKDAHRRLTEMLPDLITVGQDEQIRDETVVALLTRALRALRPRAPLGADRWTAMDALQQAIAQGPRSPGRPAVGEQRSVRADPQVWAAVDRYAAARGITPSRAAARLLEQVVQALPS